MRLRPLHASRYSNACRISDTCRWMAIQPKPEMGILPKWRGQPPYSPDYRNSGAAPRTASGLAQVRDSNPSPFAHPPMIRAPFDLREPRRSANVEHSCNEADDSENDSVNHEYSLSQYFAVALRCLWLSEYLCGCFVAKRFACGLHHASLRLASDGLRFPSRPSQALKARGHHTYR